MEPVVHKRRRSVALLLQFLALLIPIGIGGYWGCRQGWGYYHAHAAREALASRRFLDAREHLQHCLKVWPRDPETCLLAARTARRAGFTEEAGRLLSDCAALRGTQPAIELELALLQAQTGELSTGMERELRMLLQQNDGRSVLILEVLAPYYLERYRLSAAMQCLTQWLQLQPEAVQALLWQAQIFQSLDQPEEAVKNCRRALELDSGFDDARLYLTQILIGANATEEAAQHLEYLRQRRPEKPGVVLGLAVCRYKQGRVAEAEQLLESLADQPDFRAAALRELGRIALATGRAGEAERHLRASLAADAFHRDTLNTLAQCLRILGRRQEVQKCEEQLAKVEADAKRLKDLVSLIAGEPGNADLRYEAGTICGRNGQDAEAMRWLRGALDINPQHAAARKAMEKYSQQGQ